MLTVALRLGRHEEVALYGRATKLLRLMMQKGSVLMKVQMKICFLALAFITSLAMTPREVHAQFFVVEKVADNVTTAYQSTPVWCWAATIEMALKSQGVNWTQHDIVNRVKGFPKNETATAGEMTAFLNSWNFDYDGSPWRSQARHYSGVLPANVLIREVSRQRPVIVTYRTGPVSEHAVVVYGVLKPPNKKIHTIYYFDPYTGQKGALPPEQFAKSVTNSWAIKVLKN